MDTLWRTLQEAILQLRRVTVEAVNSVRNNKSLALLSLVLALGLWVYVTDEENPTVTDLLPMPMTVEPINVPAGLAVANVLETVSVRISAPDDLWQRLSVDDLRATADLSGLPAGEHDVPVRVRPARGRSNLRVVEVFPSRVRVRLEPVTQREVPVVVNIVGSPPLGYELGEPTASPSQVTVVGPKDTVELVEAAVTNINMTGATADIQQTFALTPRNLSRGFTVDGVTLNPANVTVKIPVTQKVFNRTYVVSASLRGSPAPGYRVTAVEVEPAAVTVLGSLTALQALTVITTEDVDIGGATADVVRNARLRLPEGITPYGHQIVLVRVRIGVIDGEVVMSVAPTWQDLPAGLALSYITPAVLVKVVGPLPLLQTLSPQDIVVTVDLSGLTEGRHLLSPRVEVPSELQIGDVQPPQVEVVLTTTP